MMVMEDDPLRFGTRFCLMRMLLYKNTDYVSLKLMDGFQNCFRLIKYWSFLVQPGFLKVNMGNEI